MWLLWIHPCRIFQEYYRTTKKEPTWGRKGESRKKRIQIVFSSKGSGHHSQTCFLLRTLVVASCPPRVALHPPSSAVPILVRRHAVAHKELPRHQLQVVRLVPLDLPPRPWGTRPGRETPKRGIGSAGCASLGFLWQHPKREWGCVVSFISCGKQPQQENRNSDEGG